MFFYFIVSMLGQFVLEASYSIHLLDVIMRSPVLKNVIKSVTKNLSGLGWTFFLGIILIFIYSLFGFYFYN